MKIGVIGIGKLGLSFALLAADCGYEVIGMDKREDYIQSLNNKTFTTTEPDIDRLLNNIVITNTKFTATTDINTVLEQCNIIFTFVATPSKPDGSYDHQYIEQVLINIEHSSNLHNQVFVIGCTTMPGYTETVSQRLSARGIDVVYNPEFIAQGSIVLGLQYADMVLMGSHSNKAMDTLTDIYKTIMKVPANIRRMSPTAAEITKISINCFLTMKIAYRNMIGEIAINSGIEPEVNTILEAIGDDSRIGKEYLLYYGFGYGGPCLPRDNRALGIHARLVGLTSHFQDSTDKSNNDHAAYLKKYYIDQNNNNLPFIFTQLTYKLGVDMLIESQRYKLCKDLLEAGCSVDIVESQTVVDQVKKELVQYGNRVTYGTVINGYRIAI